MECIHNYACGFIAGYGVWGIALAGTMLFFFIVQLWYYLRVYVRIPKYRNSDRGEAVSTDGISVVVLLNDDFNYIEQVLPLILGQKYDKFEVVIVEIGTGEEFSDTLALLKDNDSRIATTRIDSDPRFPISNKMAYNVGIKAARYENIILTTSSAGPVSEKWLSCMAKGFANGQVVIAYCGMEKKPGLAASLIRSTRLMQSVRYLSSAIAGRPYRGIIQNLGFTKTVYFDHKGFNRLNMNIGEDDLFIKEIATAQNTSIVMNPHATMSQRIWGDNDWWWHERKFYSAAYRFYPRAVKWSTFWELFSRAAFLLSALACIALLSPDIKITAAVLILLRMIIVSYKMSKIRRRLSERGLGWPLILHDIYAPFSEAWLAVSRKIRPEPGIYR